MQGVKVILHHVHSPKCTVTDKSVVSNILFTHIIPRAMYTLFYNETIDSEFFLFLIGKIQAA